MQRRKYARYQIWFPVQVKSGELSGAMAVNHNIGAGGMLIALSAKLEVGEKVAVAFRVPPQSDKEHKIEGLIARVEKNLEDPDGIWPFRIAVVFDEIATDLVPLLEQAVSRISEM
ncbi:MAG: PilZ domain-containing protein [Deltaproteobacteria bacterium]|nr:PilZ domain-containing protein [Deltaproteobacteria bacterium]